MHFTSIFVFFLEKEYRTYDFPGGAVVKNPPANAGDTRDACSIPGLGRCPGGGGRNDNPLQHSCLKNSTEEPSGLQSMESQRVGHN